MLRRTLAYDKFISELCVLDRHNSTQYIATVYTRALLIILLNVFVNQRNTTYKINRDCLTRMTHYIGCLNIQHTTQYSYTVHINFLRNTKYTYAVQTTWPRKRSTRATLISYMLTSTSTE